jgi:hypothetical protein
LGLRPFQRKISIEMISALLFNCFRTYLAGKALGDKELLP